jgi:hypothetical protein
MSVPSEFVFDIPDEYIEKEEKFEGRGRVVYLEI